MFRQLFATSPLALYISQRFTSFTVTYSNVRQIVPNCHNFTVVKILFTVVYVKITNTMVNLGHKFGKTLMPTKVLHVNDERFRHNNENYGILLKIFGNNYKFLCKGVIKITYTTSY